MFFSKFQTVPYQVFATKGLNKNQTSELTSMVEDDNIVGCDEFFWLAPEDNADETKGLSEMIYWKRRADTLQNCWIKSTRARKKGVPVEPRIFQGILHQFRPKMLLETKNQGKIFTSSHSNLQLKNINEMKDTTKILRKGSISGDPKIPALCIKKNQSIQMRRSLHLQNQRIFNELSLNLQRFQNKKFFNNHPFQLMRNLCRKPSLTSLLRRMSHIQSRLRKMSKAKER